MTESEWLASDDTGRMVELARSNVWSGPVPSGWRGVSYRKLRLWVEACRQVCEKSTTLAFHWHDLDLPGGLAKTLPWWSGSEATGEPSYLGHLSAADRCHLLRDIVGNPFRPVKPAECNCGSCARKGGQHHNGPCARRRLLTPNVVGLANLAYDQRDKATGHIDPVTLAALADELEEAGCGVGRVHFCEDGATAFWWNDLFGKSRPHLTPDRAAAHPLLAHLRSPGPHVRGCWAIDLITGRE